jgi:hypothetical protein
MLSGVEQMPDSISLPLSVPMRMLMKRHCQEGHAIFVQRKSGGDLIGSIDKLNLIQSKMMTWARPGGCWLLGTGIEVSKDGYVIAGGHRTERTLNSVAMKLHWWNIRGGHWEIVSGDDRIDLWLDTMVTTLDKILDDPIRFTQENEPFIDRSPVQQLVQTDADWLTTGAAFPKGWGIKARTAVYNSLVEDGLRPTLINALARVNVGKVKIPGIGPKMTQTCREWSGYQKPTAESAAGAYFVAYGKEKPNA